MRKCRKTNLIRIFISYFLFFIFFLLEEILQAPHLGMQHVLCASATLTFVCGPFGHPINKSWRATAARSMCDPRDLNRRSASAVAGPDREIIGTDTLLGACPAGAQWIAAGKTWSAPPFFLERAECSSSAPQISFFLYNFILFYIRSQYACANITFCESSSTSSLSPSSVKDRRSVEPFLWGEEPRGRASDLRELALDLKGKEEDRGSPVFIPSIWSICDSHEHSHLSTLAEVGQVPWGTLVKTPSSKRVPPPWERSIRSGSHSKMRAVGPLESDSASLQQAAIRPRTNCVCPARDIAWAGRNTQSITWSTLICWSFQMLE